MTTIKCWYWSSTVYVWLLRFPQNFVFINDYIAGAGVELHKTAVIGCECTDCVKEKATCCGHNAGSDFAYYSKRGVVRLASGMPIYECNDQCRCGPDCSNRVIQHGRKYGVCIFRTANGRGWGVKAMQRIKKGSFVMEYVGEVCESMLKDEGFTYSVTCAVSVSKWVEFNAPPDTIFISFWRRTYAVSASNSVRHRRGWGST